MRIELGEYVIRDWTMEDAPSIARHADNRRVAMWLRDRFPHPYTLNDAEAFLLAVSQQDPRLAFAIATPREAIGGIGLDRGRDVHRFTAELGYWLSESFWGKGIMTEAVKCFTPWAFEHLELHRVYANIFANNAASARVLEKAGFHREGRLRASVFKNGQFRDQLVYARIRDDIA